MRQAIHVVAFLCLTLPLCAQYRNVVVIAVDGLRGVELASLSGKQTDLPNLTKFHTEGAVSEGLIGVFPTVTAPSMASIVTGVSPAVHGVLDNYAFDPERKMNASDSANEYAELIHAPTLWSAAHDAGLRTASVYWPTTTTAVMDADFPNHTQMRNYRDRLLYRAVATPGLVAEYEKEYGELPTGSSSFNEHVITQMSLFLIRTRKPNLLLIYFQDLDHAEHKNGPQSPEAYEALKKIDADIGVLREAVEKEGLKDNTDFVLVSDHGFFPVDKSFHPNAVLASLGLRGGGKQDPETAWRVAPYGGGGAFGLVAHDPKDHEAIDLAMKTFQQLQRDGSWGIDRVLDRTQLLDARAYSNCFAAVTMKSGFLVDAGDSGPWISSASRSGSHGYFPGAKDMDAAFAAMGPGIPHVRLPRGYIVDVAATVAHLLGIEMNRTEGRDLLSKSSSK